MTSLPTITSLPVPSPREVARSGPDSVVLRLVGDHDLATADRLRADLRQVLDGAADGADLVLDGTDLGFLDVVALGVVLDAQQEVVAHGGRLLVRSPGPCLRRMVDLLALSDRLPTAPAAA